MKSLRSDLVVIISITTITTMFCLLCYFLVDLFLNMENNALDFSKKHAILVDKYIGLCKEQKQLKDAYEETLQQLHSVSSKLAVRVTVTAYNSEERQTDSTPNITAFNWRTRPGIIAVSRDLMEDHGFQPGTKVWVEGFGVMIVGDLMHPRKEKQIDVWLEMGEQPFKYENVLATVVLEGQSDV